MTRLNQVKEESNLCLAGFTYWALESGGGAIDWLPLSLVLKIFN